MRRLLDSLAQLIRLSTWYGWYLGLQSWWYTRDKSQFVFFSVLFGSVIIVPSGLYTLGHHAQQSRHTEYQLRCLAQNIYHEARGEPVAGQYAVAEVTLNRVASPRFPDTVCEVVHEKRWDWIRERDVGAFSWTELKYNKKPDQKAFGDARRIAEEVYYRRTEPQVADALFYHATYIRPSWSRNKRKVATIGRHIFYK